MLISLERCLVLMFFIMSLLPHAVLADQQQQYKESIEQLALKISKLAETLMPIEHC